MHGVTIVNKADSVCEYNHDLVVGTTYENKIKASDEGVVYAFCETPEKDGWIFKGYADIDAEEYIESLETAELNKLVISASRIKIQAEIRGKGSEISGVKKQLADINSLNKRLASGEIDIEEWKSLRATQK